MARSKFIVLMVPLFLLISSLIGFQSAAAANPNCTEVDGDYIISFTKNSNAKAELKSAPGRAIAPFFIYDSVLNGFAANLSAEQACAFAKRPNLESIELDQIVQNQDVTVQSLNPVIWSLDRIDSKAISYDSRYIYSSTGSGVKVFVVDTGINSNHSELSGRISTPGFTAIGTTTEDCNGHGTHVAGTIGGSTYGVAKQVSLTPVRVLDCNGSGSTSGVIAGLDWILKQSSTKSVVNMSLGGGASSALDTAVTKLTSSGITVVVAAGNSKRDACNFSPSRVPSAITVAASDRNDQFASFSNFGKCVDIIAPGVNITSAWIGTSSETKTISGTSMSAPHVVGAVARLISFGSPVALNVISNTNLISSVPRGTSNLFLYLDPNK